ncbi:unnamed protein product, partial [marine sediment metagenome]
VREWKELKWKLTEKFVRVVETVSKYVFMMR